MASNSSTKRSSRRSNTLQASVPPSISDVAERSVVSALTTPSPPVRPADRSFEVRSDDDDDENVNLFEKEFEKDMKAGDGGDSDVEGEECFVHLNGEDGESEDGGDSDSDVEVETVEKHGTKGKGILDLTNSSGEVVGDILYSEGDVVVTNDGTPKKINIYQAPANWSRERYCDRGEPDFEDVDNPGEWPSFCFRPKFTKDKKYIRHSLPTGAMAVPINKKTGKRELNGWEFHYRGWKNPGTLHRHGATSHNMFPKETEGSLDANMLTKLGLDEDRMGKNVNDVDSLFFLQLILPICCPEYSGIKGDPRISYYHDVERHTNGSKYHTGLGGSYGHSWKAVSLQELTVFDGILVRDGVLGGTQGALHRRWDKQGPCYDSVIASAMTLTRFGEIKRSLKLCNNLEAPKRGQGKYDTRKEEFKPQLLQA